MEITPLHDNVLVRMLPDNTDSKIIVERELKKAKVLSIGPGVDEKQKEHKRPLAAGDVVWLPRGNKTGEKFGEDLLLVPFNLISCIVK